MRALQYGALTVASLISLATSASVWSFEDASLSVLVKGAGEASKKQPLSSKAALSSAVTLSPDDTIRLILTVTEGKTGKRPNQAFLTLHEQETGLDESFALSVKESGKARVELSQKDLPYQFLTTQKPIKASLVLGSFGSSTPLHQHVFDITVNAQSVVVGSAPASERYVSKPEIHHIFNADPRSPPKIISLVFTLAVLASLPALFGTWLLLGGNLAHFGKAFGASPISHGLFLGSILAMEGVFFLYYVSWNLFQTLPVAGVVAIVAYISGSRALTEVQDRRLAGER